MKPPRHDLFCDYEGLKWTLPLLRWLPCSSRCRERSWSFHATAGACAWWTTVIRRGSNSSAVVGTSGSESQASGTQYVRSVRAACVLCNFCRQGFTQQTNKVVCRSRVRVPKDVPNVRAITLLPGWKPEPDSELNKIDPATLDDFVATPKSDPNTTIE